MGRDPAQRVRQSEERTQLAEDLQDAAKQAPEDSPQREEERLRQEVLSELDRSQMPAIHKDDGKLQKTIEHYTFADALEAATISIELDKDLFEGASAFSSEDLVEVDTREDGITIWL